MEDNTRVLVVEVDATLRCTLAKELRAWGHVVETACDGCEALQKVTRFDPKVIISDMVTPCMGGIELLRAIRDELRDTCFIILTDNWRLERVFEAARLGAFAVLQKPVEVEQLRADLRDCLDHHSLAKCCSNAAFSYCEGGMYPSLRKYGFRTIMN